MFPEVWSNNQSLICEATRRAFPLSVIHAKSPISAFTSTLPCVFYDKNHVINVNTQITQRASIYTKETPLLTPNLFITGHYGDGTLPNTNRLKKYERIHNSAFVETLFYYVSSELIRSHQFFHAVDFYGECVGLSPRYAYNYENELSWFEQNPFYQQHLNKLFTFNEPLCIEPYSDAQAEEIDILDVCDCTQLNEDNWDENETGSHSSSSYTDEEPEKDKHSEGAENDDDNDDDADEYKDDDVSSFCSESVNEADDYSFEHLYLLNYPVQYIHIEKCECTLADRIQSPQWTAEMVPGMLFQVAFILYVYQSKFRFTHNDLHTRNIVCNRTDKEFIYYTIGSKTYRVPTYGYIYKIIDFGRSIFTWNGRQYYSDEYAPNENAVGVYNSGPFVNASKPIHEPNPAFDLCYLAVDLYNTLTPICIEPHQLTPLQQMLTRWVTDDYGNNIVRSRTGVPKNEGIKLYKVIARHVHYPIPANVIEQEPIFQTFLCTHPTLDDELSISYTAP